MSKENDKIFAELSKAIVEKHKQATDGVKTYSELFIKTSYRMLSPLKNAEGEVISKVDPKEIADHITVNISYDVEDSGIIATKAEAVVTVAVTGSDYQEEAGKQYALSDRPESERNPFLGAYLILQKSDKLKDIMGSK